MRQRLVIYQLLLFCFLSKNLFAQPAAIRNNRDYYHWMFGVGWNFVDDDGYDFSNFFDVKNSWHSVAFPSRFTADKYFYNGWSFEGALAFNSYDETKLVNRTIGNSGMFLSTDINMKYSFLRLFGPSELIDPYFSFGLGATYRQAIEGGLFNTNFNVSGGLNIWITSALGIQVQTSGKIALTSDIITTNKDYMQHSIGLVFKISEPSITKNRFNKSRYKIKKIRVKKKKKKKSKQ